MKNIVLFFAVLFSGISAIAQSPQQQAATVTSSIKMTSSTEGVLIININPSKGWHIYSAGIAKGGPRPLKFDVSQSTGIKLVEDLKFSINPEKHFDRAFNMDVSYWSSPVTLEQKFKLDDANSHIIVGYIQYQGCNDESCSPPKKYKFSHEITR